MSMNNRSRRQSGLSMIELLVALAISSFLILGITQIYLDNKRNYLFQQGQAGNQENGRFAMMFLDQQLAKVGFRRRADDPNEFAFKALAKSAFCEEFKAGATLVPAIAKTGQAGFCYRYQPAPGEAYDCEGNSITTPSDPFGTADAIIARILFIPPTADAPGTLTCSAQSLKDRGQEIVSGLVDFKLEYGVGPTMAGKREVESFVEQADIADRPVRALRYSALMASDKNLRQGDSKTLDDWITLYPSSKTSLQGNDKDRLYQIAKGSQTLRNLVP
ncbi:type 4a pilus minor pilin PilW [Pseudomonas aeruginosa]|uniref:type 4a pilus minor pilin PilW n=1 Tax=Pseudomonas aeruginosa TaxID=287 RepID=UPI000EAD5F63|nr:type 4a pilus minor pilin PilW [Pseudomonas aeruginosa]